MEQVADALAAVLRWLQRCDMEKHTGLFEVILSPEVMIALIIALVFRRPISDLLKRLKFCKYGDFELLFENDIIAIENNRMMTANLPLDEAKKAWAEPPPEDEARKASAQLTPFTADDLLTTFRKIPELETWSGVELGLVSQLLTQKGIITKDQLEDLVKADEVLNVVRELYITELKRPSDWAIDPLAVAAWAARLFVSGLHPEIIEGVRRAIRKSPEYKEKQRS